MMSERTGAAAVADRRFDLMGSDEELVKRDEEAASPRGAAGVPDRVESAASGAAGATKPADGKGADDKVQTACCSGCAKFFKMIGDGIRDAFVALAQSIVDFFVNMFRARDEVDDFAAKIAKGSLQEALKAARELIQWTKVDGRKMTEAQVRRANAAIQDCFERCRYYDPHVSRKETVRQALEVQVGLLCQQHGIDMGKRTPLEFMKAFPRHDVVVVALAEIETHHLGFTLEAAARTLVEVEKYLPKEGAPAVGVAERGASMVAAMMALGNLLRIYERVDACEDDALGRKYTEMMARLMKVIVANDLTGGTLARGMFDTFDVNKQQLPGLSAHTFYEALRDRVQVHVRGADATVVRMRDLAGSEADSADDASD